jgi:hypothetical protein
MFGGPLRGFGGAADSLSRSFTLGQEDLAGDIEDLKAAVGLEEQI